MKVKWATCDNESGSNTLKQHAFIPHTRKRPYTSEEYAGNKALCTSGGALVDEYEYEDFDKLDEETFKPQRACKRCLRIINLTKGNDLI